MSDHIIQAIAERE